MIVRLSEADQQVPVTGPTAPTSTGGAQNISSSWFDLLPD